MLSAEELYARAKQANTARRFTASWALLAKALTRARDPATAALIVGCQGFVEAERGRPAAGLALLTSALDRGAELPVAERAVLLAQRGLVLLRLGRHDESLADYEAALPGLVTRPDDLGKALLNRATLFLQTGRFDRAQDDLTQAVDHLAALPVQQAMARHNLGYAAGMAGDLPRGLHEMAEAEVVLAPLSVESAAVGEQDRAEALLAAGLVDEGVTRLERAASLFGRRGWRRAQAEAEFVLARTLVFDDAPAAARWARRARRRFELLGAAAWALRCAGVDAVAAIEQRRGSAGEALSLAVDLAAAGFTNDAHLLGVLARRAAFRDQQELPPEVVLDPTTSPLALRLLRADVEAELRHAAGDAPGAEALLRDGLAEVEASHAQLGSLDLQTSVPIHAERLAARGLALAVSQGSPQQVYEWVERTGAMAGRVSPVRPPADPQTAADLSELRVLAQRGAEPGTADYARIRTLTRRVRERAWQDAGPRQLNTLHSLERLRTELAASASSLVAPLVADDTAWALVVNAGGEHVVRLCPAARVRAALRGLPADLDVAASDVTGPLAQVVIESLRERLADLDDLVLAPLAGLLTEPRVVMNPSGLFSGLPWTLMPTLHGRAITIPRSASGWISARQRPHEYAVAGFASGPRLERADAEVMAGASAWQRAEVVTGAQADARAVSDLAGRVDVLHLAAHGHHEPENPLFSNLELADGPWFGYDLDQLPDIPEVVILSACELGATTIRRGDELLGLTTAWLHAGARCVIASPASVSDVVAAVILPEVHAHLARGVMPADALVAATARHPDLVSTFQCYGTGW